MKVIAQGYPAFAYTGGVPYDAALPAVLLLHGAAMGHSAWQWQSRYLAHHGFAVIAPDLPGHGRSPGTARTSVEALADWAADLLAALGRERACVAGHSLGSLVALELAMRHPGRVAALALAGVSVPMPVGEAFLAAARDDDPAAFDMEATWGLARLSQLAASPVPGLVLHGANRRLMGRAAPGVQYADLSACHAYAPRPEAIRAIAAPTLVVAGRRDVMTPPRAGQALAREIPGARLELLDTGHDMPKEAPGAMARALQAHFAARERPATR
jgi:pimeloyl-ACP methyl ester carboxylesterase